MEPLTMKNIALAYSLWLITVSPVAHFRTCSNFETWFMNSELSPLDDLKKERDWRELINSAGIDGLDASGLS
jgi:hypothetical protein